MNSMNTHQLNTAAETLLSRSDWDPDLIDLLAHVVASIDQAVTSDMIETLGQRTPANRSPRHTARYLAQCASPEEVALAWQAAEQYIATITLPDLNDVIGQITDWDDFSRQDLEYWVVANASRERIAAAATVAGQAELANDLLLDAGDLALALTRRITPSAMRYAWNYPRPRHLIDSEKAELRRLRGRRRLHRQRPYRAPGADLIQRLQADRRTGVPIAELAAATELSTARIYQLTQGE